MFKFRRFRKHFPRFSKWMAKWGWGVLFGTAFALEEGHEYGAALLAALFGVASLASSVLHWGGLETDPKLTKGMRVVGYLFALVLLVISVFYVVGEKGTQPWSRLSQAMAVTVIRPRTNTNTKQPNVTFEARSVEETKAQSQPSTSSPSPLRQKLETANSPSGSTPTFKVIPGDFLVILGGHEYSVSPDSSRTHPTNIAPFGDSRAIQAYVDHRVLCVDVNLYYDANKSLKLTGNVLRDYPRKWDVNSDKSAIEIVDDKLVPRFQLVYKDARTAELRGVFQFPSGAVVFDEKAHFFWGSLEDKVNITRLFKYPSRLYQGEESSGVSTPAAQSSAPSSSAITQNGTNNIAQIGNNNQATIGTISPLPRIMSDEEISSLINAISPHPAKILLLYTQGDQEAYNLAKQLEDAFSAAHWQLHQPATATLVMGEGGPPPTGIEVNWRGDAASPGQTVRLDSSTPWGSLSVRVERRTHQHESSSRDADTRRQAVA